MPELILPSFAKGELSPELYGRVDTAAYKVGLAKARNMLIHTYGGASYRPGTKYVGPVKNHANAPRLIEFQFKTTDKYVLEFGDQYMRVIRDGAHVITNDVSITDITRANPAVVTAASHGFSDGDEVYITGVVGMVEVNNNRYIVANQTTNTFELTSQVDGTDIDSSSYTAYSSGGTVSQIYEISTPYSIDDVFDLDFTQSADIMTIVHKSYDIYELQRTDHDAWTLAKPTLSPTVDFPDGETITVNTTGSETDRYRVTATDRETGEESLPAIDTTAKTITGATQASPVVVTSTSHGLSNGEEVYITGVVGMTELNGNRYFIANVATNTFELTDEDGADIDGTGYTAYSSGGSAYRTYSQVTNSNTTRNNTITWNNVSGASRYSVYRRKNGLYGFIGDTELNTFDDTNIAPDTDLSPPEHRNPFKEVDDQPGAVGYFEQRRVFGGSTNKPDTSNFSQVGRPYNFNVSTPTQDDDAITATLNSQQVNEIRHFISLNDLIVFTSGSEWRISAGPDNLFGPDTIRQKPQSYWGASRVPPVVIGDIILFVTEDGSNIRSLGYVYTSDEYKGSNLNILSNHFLRGYSIVDWAVTRTPESRLYIIRNDGMLLTLSFDPEQQVVAWTACETSGSYESACSLRSGGAHSEDVVYLTVKRTVDGNIVRYIETMTQQYISDVRDAFFVDCGLSYDSPVTITGATATNPVVITAASHGFSDGDEVDIFDIVWVADVDSVGTETQPDQLNRRRFKVVNSTTNTFELTDLDDNDIDGSAYNAYVSGGTVRAAVQTLIGLGHLEGREVVCLADGNVVSGLTVADASITLPRKFSRIHVGLAYVGDLETLPLEAPAGTIQGYKKQVNKVTVRFFKSRGLFVGPVQADGTFDLTEMKQREYEDMGDPTALLTGDKAIRINSTWDLQGKILCRQIYPLPLTILAIIPSIEVGSD